MGKWSGWALEVGAWVFLPSISTNRPNFWTSGSRECVYSNDVKKIRTLIDLFAAIATNSPQVRETRHMLAFPATSTAPQAQMPGLCHAYDHLEGLKRKNAPEKHSM